MYEAETQGAWASNRGTWCSQRRHTAEAASSTKDGHPAMDSRGTARWDWLVELPTGTKGPLPYSPERQAAKGRTSVDPLPKQTGSGRTLGAI